MNKSEYNLLLSKRYKELEYCTQCPYSENAQSRVLCLDCAKKYLEMNKNETLNKN